VHLLDEIIYFFFWDFNPKTFGFKGGNIYRDNMFTIANASCIP